MRLRDCLRCIKEDLDRFALFGAEPCLPVGFVKANDLLADKEQVVIDLIVNPEGAVFQVLIVAQQLRVWELKVFCIVRELKFKKFQELIPHIFLISVRSRSALTVSSTARVSSA